jgi:hypothetical protein
MLTLPQVEKALPPNLRGAATPQFVNVLNNLTQDPEVGEAIRKNFITYTHVLKDGKWSTDEYLNAIQYVTYKLMGYSNQDAYIKTFPQRYASHLARGASAKDISAYVAMYNKGLLVNAILEQSLVPVWLLNQDAYQKAINAQVHLMTSAHSEMVRTQAANSILTHLAKPKEVAGALQINLQDNSGMRELTELMRAVAAKQVSAIQGGVPAKEIASQRLIEVEPEPETTMEQGIPFSLGSSTKVPLVPEKRAPRPRLITDEEAMIEEEFH